MVESGVLMVMQINFKKLIKNLAIPLGVGLVSGFLTRGGVEEFNLTAIKPFFMPPGWAFPVAWTILYVLMGIAAYLIDVSPNTQSKKFAQALYYVQLFFNFAWMADDRKRLYSFGRRRCNHRSRIFHKHGQGARLLPAFFAPSKVVCP